MGGVVGGGVVGGGVVGVAISRCHVSNQFFVFRRIKEGYPPPSRTAGLHVD